GSIAYGGAFYYSNAWGRMIDLQQLVDPSLQATLLNAAAINDNHEIVGSVLYRGDPVRHAYKMRLPDAVAQPCPAPADRCAGTGTIDAAAGGCTYSPLPDGAACAPDGSSANTCHAGVCTLDVIHTAWKVIGPNDPIPLELPDPPPSIEEILDPIVEEVRAIAPYVSALSSAYSSYNTATQVLQLLGLLPSSTTLEQAIVELKKRIDEDSAVISKQLDSLFAT